MKLEFPYSWNEAVQQQNFRSLLQAMSRPGSVVPLQLQQPGQTSALQAVLATLLDASVTLADPDRLLSVSLWSLLQARSDEVELADFIVCQGGVVPQFTPKLGTLSEPEKSATLILVVDNLPSGITQFVLSGPGVKGKIQCGVDGLHPEWLQRREQWVAAFPLGVDCVLVNDDSVMAVPRSTRLEII